LHENAILASLSFALYISFMDPMDDQWTDWYRLTPAERWRESQKLWDFFLTAGGSLDDQPDSQSPFSAILSECAMPPNRRPGVHILRRGGV
jgi:hypothetical protein